MLLISTTHGKQYVADCCERADGFGVRTGMTVAHACSLLQGSKVFQQPHTPVQDEEKVVSLAGWASRFSPVLAPDPPDGLLIDIAGCEHLFGGEEGLARAVFDALDRLGFPTRVAVASTFGCARAVARFGRRTIARVAAGRVRETLGALPLVALRLEPSVSVTLNEMGVERISQMLDLPRDELAARFGHAMLEVVDQALGHSAEVIEPVQVAAPLEVSHVFGGPVKAIHSILVVIQKLLGDLIVMLKRQQEGVRFLMVELVRPRLEPECVSFQLTYPSSNVEHLWSMLRPKLERVNLGYGVEEIFLRTTHVGRIIDEQFTLWPDDFVEEAAGPSTSFGELVDQLVHRLGGQSVSQVSSRQRYVPERAFRRRNPNEARAAEASKDTCGKVYAAPRPSHLLKIPERIRVIALVPDGPPAWLEWQRVPHTVKASFGPERITFPWWEDGPTPTRDYYMVEDELGRWLWIFRELTSSDAESSEWYVQGEWA
ncbi:MAG: nucleotidyltransferase [Phycisphaerae bacterium]|nr:MAG: nucleotidyltransferase [Phycisphaerae bacterium]